MVNARRPKSIGSDVPGAFVFVSYDHDDAEMVYAEIEALADAGIGVYYDEGIHPGSTWHEELARAIERCAAFVIFLTDRSAASRNCQRELSFALDRNRPVLAVYLHGFEPPPGLRLAIGDRQAIDRSAYDEDAFRAKLINAVRSHLGPAQPRAAPGARRRPRWRARRRQQWLERAAWIVAIGAIALGVARWGGGSDLLPGSPSPIRFSIAPPEGGAFYSGYDSPVAVSPDGQTIAYVTIGNPGPKQLWVRELASGRARALDGTGGASMPFWSPDSQWLGFFADDSLKKVRLAGGSPELIARGVSYFAGAAWSKKGVIVFPTAPTSGLAMVSDRGGEVAEFTEPIDSNGQLWPQFLADGEHVLYGLFGAARAIQVSSLSGGSPRTLIEFPGHLITSAPAYVPGYLLYIRDGVLLAQPFDEVNLSVGAELKRVVDGIPVMGPGRAPFGISASTLAYWPYPIGEPAVLEWVDRNGESVAAELKPSRYVGFALAPDDQRVVLSQTVLDGRSDVWLKDLARGTEARLTSGGVAFTPLWSPDGLRVAFGAANGGPPDVFVKMVDGSGGETQITRSPAPEFPTSWSRDGTRLVYAAIDPIHGHDLYVAQLEDDSHVRLPIDTDFNERHGKLSPDQRWIAYGTDASGTDEVWIAEFPAGNNRQQVSVSGGGWPLWNPVGNELFYLAPGNVLMGARVEGSTIGTPTRLFALDDLIEMHRIAFPTAYAYDVSSDGNRFLVARRARDPDAPLITVIANWKALM